MQYPLTGELQEIPLNIVPFAITHHMPNQMKVVVHNDKRIQGNSSFFDKKPKALHDDVFETIPG
jgi:hypothetical protein